MNKIKLWIGGEIQADVADTFREARCSVEQAINTFLADKSYDLDFDEWDCVAILRDDDEFEERLRFTAGKRDMDIRIKINIIDFIAENALGRQRLIYQMLLKSLDLLRGHKAIKKPFDRLLADLTSLAQSKGWSGIK